MLPNTHVSNCQYFTGMQEESGKKKPNTKLEVVHLERKTKVPPVHGHLSRITATLGALKYETNQPLYNPLTKTEVRHLPLLKKL